MKTSNVSPTHANAIVAGHVGQQAASTGLDTISDGTTDVSPATLLTFAGATVSELTELSALVTIDVILYRLAFAWNTASISTGVTICSLLTGDVILGAWLDVSTAWNSTVSDAGDIITTTTSESLLSGTVNMQSVGAGTDRRKLKNGVLNYSEQSLMLSAQAIKVKVTSTGISLSTGAATAFVLVQAA